MASTVAGSRRLEWLQRQRESAIAEVETLTERAADDDRELTDTERALCERRRTEVDGYDRELEVEVDLLERNAKYDEMAAKIGPVVSRRNGDSSNGTPAPAEPEPVYRSAGEYLSDFILYRDNPNNAPRFGDYLKRAVANQLLADNPGIVPTPIVGPVWNTITTRRPAVEAATRRPMPAGGKTFTRPKVTQHTNVAKQATEKTELASQKMTIAPLTVTKETYGGVVDISFQDRDWTTPPIMDIVVADLAGIYAQQTDGALCTAFAAAVTQTQAVTGTPPTGAQWLAAIYSAAATVYGTSNMLPTTIWLSVDAWAQIAALVDSAGRPLFPPAGGGTNALGAGGPTTFVTNVAGLVGVVDSHFAAKTAIVGDPMAVEFYEQIGGQLSATEPSILGVTVAFYGYAATCVVDPTAFVKLTWT